MNMVKMTAAGVCGVALLLLTACSAQSGDEASADMQSYAVRQSAPSAHGLHQLYLGAIARSRSRGHDGGKGHGPGGGSCASRKSVQLTPSATGWIDASSNPLGIQGSWYVYADGYGADGLRDGPCQAVGHADSECALITSPIPGPGGFPNVGGEMCTSGAVDQVLDLNGAPDYGNMFGTGMGFNLASTTTGEVGVFDARAHRVIGVQFDLDAVPTAGLYVGFATPASDAGSLGPDYWGASAAFQSSPVVAGTNVVLFRDVQSPEASPVPIDVTQLESMQFQVRSSTVQSSTFAYCVSNVKALLGP
jgi:hypothetical protein